MVISLATGLRRIYLQPLVEELESFDRQMSRIYAKAYDDTVDEIKRLKEEKPGQFSAKVRIAQLEATRQALHVVMDEMFAGEEVLLTTYVRRVAAIAASVGIKRDKKIIDALDMDEDDKNILRSNLIGIASRGIEAVLQRNSNKRSLSDKVWDTKALADKQIDRIIDSSIAQGSSAADIAKRVQEFANPATPGGAPYAAKRLGRTEIANAYHAQNKVDYQDRPWITAVSWNLSKSHPTGSGCRCELYYMKKSFPPSSVPDKPHPQCLCFITPITKSEDELMADIFAGRYDSWVQHNSGTTATVTPLRTGGSRE